MTVAAPNPPTIAARWHGGAQTPRTIVMHGTVSPCVPGGARSVARFFATEDNKTSAHYVRDPLETIRCVPDHTVAYHCGYNQDSIGYELCDPQAGSGARWSDKNHTAMLAGAARDVARLCLAYGIPAVKIGPVDLKAGKHGICGHADMTAAFHRSTHTDPGSNFPWGIFIGLVKAQITALRAASQPAPPKPAPAHLDPRAVAIRNDWREHGLIDTHALSAYRKTGDQPAADAIAANQPVIEDAMGDIYAHLTSKTTNQTRVRNLWREGGVIDNPLLSNIRSSGRQPAADAIAKHVPRIETAMRAIYNALGN